MKRQFERPGGCIPPNGLLPDKPILPPVKSIAWAPGEEEHQRPSPVSRVRSMVFKAVRWSCGIISMRCCAMISPRMVLHRADEKCVFKLAALVPATAIESV
jgi:hypothetical protein